MYFNVGSRWSELDVGTNAIGMVLDNKQAEFMSLDDHYAIASRRWSCAAVPIFDSNQDLIGILDLNNSYILP
ncbi:GAF domain-containing protein [Enterococcus cecorum]|nr:GAF domain-containing protein [Enterococcus cecorum]